MFLFIIFLFLLFVSLSIWAIEEREKEAAHFQSNGSLIAGWNWLRDSNLAQYAEWNFENIPPGSSDLKFNITALATDGVNGGRGYESKFKIIYGFPGSGNMGGVFKTKTVILPNVSTPNDPVGYHCQGQISLDREFIPAASSILIRIERESANDNHVAFNKKSIVLLTDDSEYVEERKDSKEAEEKQFLKGDQLPETDKIEEATLIKPGTYIGILGKVDREGHLDNSDFYSVEVEEGQLITLHLSVPGNARFHLALLNPNRNSRGSAATEEEYKVLDYVADSTGTWYVRINRSSGEGEYQLSVDIQNQNDAGSGQDAGDSYQEAIPLSSGSVPGFLKAGDNSDFYSVEVEEGQLINLKLSVPGNASYHLSLMNPNHNSRGSTVTKENTKTLDYITDSNGTWYIRINRSSGEGEYQLSVDIQNQNDAGSGQDAGDFYEEAIPLTAGNFNGFLKAGDNTDFYSIHLQEGEFINLNLAIPGNANFNIALLNPNHNSRGSSITHGDNKILEYTADSNGTWYIRINRSSGEGEYQLVLDINTSIVTGTEGEAISDGSIAREEAEIEDEEVAKGRFRESETTVEDGENIPPVALCEFPAVAMIGEVTFDASSSYDPDGEIVSYQWELRMDGKTIDSFSEEKLVYKFSETGKYEIVLIVVDDREAKDIKTFTINIVSPTDHPIAQFTYNLAIGEENNFLFDGSNSYGPSPIVEYEWDFGDGSVPITGKQVEHKFVSHGTYRVILTVVDQNGKPAKETKEIDTTLLLTASFAFSPGEPGVSERVNFDASLSQSLRTIETYQWDFGDRSEEVYGINVEHSFEASGIYEVILTITDESGETSTATKEITVLAIDVEAFVQCGTNQANSGQRIPFRAAFKGQPIVVTSAVVDGNAMVISTPNNITNTHFDIIINDSAGNPVSNSLIHWIAFMPDSDTRCFGGISETGGQLNIPINFDSPINFVENEQLIVLTNAEKNQAYLSRVSNVNRSGFQVEVSDHENNPVYAYIYWMAVVPDTMNGFQGSVDTLNNGEEIVFGSPFPNQSACVCNSSAPGVMAGAINSTPQQFSVGLSVESAEVNWLAFGGAVPPLQTGQIRFSSTPGGATVYLNGSNVGTTPLDDVLEITELSPGEYTVKLELQDYHVFETEVTVTPTETVIVNPNLHTNPGTIIVSSDPPGAIIRIDDSPNYPFYWDNEQGWVDPKFGTTQDEPVELSPIPPGEHTLTLELDHYATWSGTHDLEPGGTWTIQAVLEPDPGTISVTSTQSGAKIYLAEGDWAEQTDSEEITWIEKGTIPASDIYGTAVPLLIENIATGVYTVKCSSNYYQEIVQSVQVNSNLTTELHFDLVPALAYVEIIAQDEKENYLPRVYTSFSPCFGTGCNQGPTNEDGISVGNINAGPYSVRAMKQNYVDYTDNIDITNIYTEGNPLQINAILIGEPGSIDVNSSPSGASIYLAEIDQTSVSDEEVDWEEQEGITPLTISGVTQGTYTIKIFLESYIPSDLSSDVLIPFEGYPFIETVTVNPGETSYITADFTQMTGHIIVNSNEEGVYVFIDDIAKGSLVNMPVGGYQVPTGTHNVRVTKDNFISDQINVYVGNQETVTVDANLYQAQSLTALIDMTPSYGKPKIMI